MSDKNKNNKTMKNNIQFQILDWTYYHDDTAEIKRDSDFDSESDSQDSDEDGIGGYTIRLFGRTKENKAVYAKVNNYKPYFYVEIGDNWSDSVIQTVINKVKSMAEDSGIKGANGESIKGKKLIKGFLGYKKEKWHKFWGFTNAKLFTFLKLTFCNYDTMRLFSNVLNSKIYIRSLSKEPIGLNRYESNIEPYLRCMHIQNLEAVGWINISNYTPISQKTTCCEINIETDWTLITPVEDRSIQPFIIASVDIECKSQDSSFPNPQRIDDPIIQIGTTLSRFGEDDCYENYILTLDTCDKIENATVIECKTEAELLLKWSSLIRRIDPDIITGYNIVGFDFNYMMERAKILNIKHKFEQLSRIRGERSEWIEKKLVSAALGDNILKYYNMTGRIIIDMMKVIQRDHKLASYKLDYVASYFIREDVIRFEIDKKKNTTTIISKSKYGIKQDQFVTIYYNDGVTDNSHMNGTKFKVLDFIDVVDAQKNKDGILENIKRVGIVVDGIIDSDIIDKKYHVAWCHAKDDIDHKDIPRLQAGTKKDRAIIAKYCIQDCALCNKLMAKLQVITNNVGMANVCHVPLSYLFVRGQGVKIFSLVSRKCRLKNHLIPLLTKKKVDKDKIDVVALKKKEEDEKNLQKHIHQINRQHEGEELEDDDDGYEGAIVFKPTTGVHYEPIPVLDYASLYPRSMILKNLSHEYLVNDPNYANLPGFKYHAITYMVSKDVIDVDKRKRKMSELKFRKKRKEILTEYKKKKYIIETSTREENDNSHVTKIYDLTENGNKRYMVAEIEIDNSAFRFLKYETAIFAEKIDGEKGIIPQILQDLLDARSKYKKLMDLEKDGFKRSILDGLQQAYKVTANSLYGQTGASTSPICMKEIAASTTATGREYLCYSKEFVETTYSKMINTALESKSEFMALCKETFKDVPDKKFVKKDISNTRQEFFDAFYKKMNDILTGYTVTPKIIYGDTDSVFFKCGIRDKKTGEIKKDKKSLEQAIQIGIWASITICTLLPDPMAQEYEKTFYPFIILTKKRYVGNLYEKDPKKYKQKSMGIVLKRRDNAPIVKIVCGGIVDQVLNKFSSKGAVEFTQRTLKEILSGNFRIDRFVITKTLRENYKDRTRIVHAVLADRIEKRTGIKVLPNERLPYVYKIVKESEVNLQGDRVETPEYLLENNIKIDYLFYITNQIMKPAIQFLELIIKNPNALFDEYIVREQNRRSGLKTLKYFFANCTKKTECENADEKSTGSKSNDELQSDNENFSDFESESNSESDSKSKKSKVKKNTKKDESESDSESKKSKVKKNTKKEDSESESKSDSESDSDSESESDSKSKKSKTKKNTKKDESESDSESKKSKVKKNTKKEDSDSESESDSKSKKSKVKKNTKKDKSESKKSKVKKNTKKEDSESDSESKKSKAKRNTKKEDSESESESESESDSKSKKSKVKKNTKKEDSEFKKSKKSNFNKSLKNNKVNFENDSDEEELIENMKKLKKTAPRKRSPCKKPKETIKMFTGGIELD